MLRGRKRQPICLLVVALGALLAGGTSARSFGAEDVTELQLSVLTPGSVARAQFAGARGEDDHLQHAEYLYALGETFSFDLSVAGQNGALSVDLLPGNRVLYRFPRNTIAAGCTEPLVARLEDPDGRVRSLRLCTGRETIAFEATAGGIHTLVLDPPAARTGTIAVTLFLDEPEVSPGGPFFEDLVFINGSRSYGLSVTAAYRLGIAQVRVRRRGAGIVASSSYCRRRCPAERRLRTTIDTRRLGEGRHEYLAEAVGPDGRSSDTEGWAIYIDRTAPRPPKNFRVESYESATRAAVIVWDEGVDPKGRYGAPAAGPAGSDYRLRRDDGSWSPWRSVQAPFLEISGVSAGSSIGLRVREHDAADNTSRIAEARVRVPGSEPPPEPE
ncbi:MAG: hypothetical protein H0U00_15180 [Actinobacteria bacterium]|nr:hypothetical protein [Actinomycetota bacterium]